RTKSPYRLYALSNLGSFLVLFAFPIVFEPYFPLKMQGRFWALGYLLFAIGCCACAVLTARAQPREPQLPRRDPAPAATLPEGTNPPSLANLALWFALAATASVLFLATTNQLCQDVAVIPLLWILPLGIYLLSLILCFEHPRWFARNWFHATFPLAVFAACFL